MGFRLHKTEKKTVKVLAKTVTKAKVATKAKTEVKKTDSKLTKTKEFDRKSIFV